MVQATEWYTLLFIFLLFNMLIHHLLHMVDFMPQANDIAGKSREDPFEHKLLAVRSKVLTCISKHVQYSKLFFVNGAH